MPRVIIEGQEHEVALDAIRFDDGEIPAGFVTAAQHEAAIKARLQRADKSARTKLAADADFIAEILEARGVELREDGSVKGSLKDQKQLEERWKAQHVTPLQTQLEQAARQIGELRQSQLNADVLRHADGVKPGLKDAFVREVAAQLQLDEESGRWGVRGEDAFKFTPDGKLMGAEHVIADLRKSQPDWFASSRMTGSNLAAADTAGRRTYSQAQLAELAADPKAWAAAEADILAAQGDGRIID